MNRWAALALFLLASYTAAALGGLAASSTPEQYATLEQPSWAPPSWLFGPVWSILYTLIGIAGWLIWERMGKTATIWWGAQMAVNAVWTPLFFGLEWRALALAWIIGLDVLVALLIWKAWKPARPAAWMLAPYLAWISFATALNGAIWWLNRA